MIKKIGIVLLSIIVANLFFFGVEAIGHKIYPPTLDIFSLSPEQQAEYIAGLPIGALLLVWVAYVVGSIIGGFTVGKLGKQSFGIQGSYWVGGILTVLGVLNLMMIPHPMWFAVLTTVTYLPLCWFGAKSTL